MNDLRYSNFARIFSRVFLSLLVAVALMSFHVTAAPPAQSADRVVKDVLWQGGPACAGSKRYTIISEAQGKVRHRWIFEPPHLGYKWHGGVAGKHMSMAYDETQTNGRDVYDAQVIAKSFNGRSPKIERAYGVCK